MPYRPNAPKRDGRPVGGNWRVLPLIAALACVAGPRGAAAQSSTFTAEAYVLSVLATSPEVRQAAALYESARAGWKSQAAAAWMPTLAFSASATPYGRDPAESNRFQHWNLARPDTNLATGLNLNLFNSFSDYDNTRQASLSRDSADAQLSTTRQARAFAAAQAFYDLGLKDRLVEVASESLRIQKDGYDLTLNLYQNGMKSLADLLKSETGWHTSEFLVTQALASRKQSLMEFNLLIDRPARAPAALSVELEPGTTALPPLEADVEAALSRRPEMIAARLAVELGEISVEQATRNGLPQLALNASYNRLDNGANVGGAPPDYRLGLSLSLPAGFNGASQWLNVSAAKSAAAAARQSLSAQSRAVRIEVYSAYNALEVSFEAYRIASLMENIAKMSFELVTEQYRQDTADAIRLAQAQLDYLTARTERVQALFGTLMSRYQYRLAIGEPL